MSIINNAFSGLNITPTSTVSDLIFTDYVEDNNEELNQANGHNLNDLIDANYFLSQGLTQLIKHRNTLDDESNLTEAAVQAHMGVIETVAKMTMCYSEINLDMEAKNKSLSQKYDLFIQKIAVKIIGVFKGIGESLKNKYGGISKEVAKANELKKLIDKNKGNDKITLPPSIAASLADLNADVDLSWVGKTLKFHDMSPAIKVIDHIKGYLDKSIKLMDKELEESGKKELTINFESVIKDINNYLDIGNDGVSGSLPGGYTFIFNEKSKTFSFKRDLDVFKSIDEEVVKYSDVIKLFELATSLHSAVNSNYKKANKEIATIEDYIFKTIKNSDNSANHSNITEVIADAVRNTNSILSSIGAIVDCTKSLHSEINEVTEYVFK